MSTRVKGYKTVGGSRIEGKIQENVDAALVPLQRSKILDGILLRNVSLTSGVNEVSHRLDRRLTGWLVVRQRASANIWDEQDTNVTATKTLRLQASVDVVVDLWVF